MWDLNIGSSGSSGVGTLPLIKKTMQTARAVLHIFVEIYCHMKLSTLRQYQGTAWKYIYHILELFLMCSFRRSEACFYLQHWLYHRKHHISSIEVAKEFNRAC